MHVDWSLLSCMQISIDRRRGQQSARARDGLRDRMALRMAHKTVV